MQASLAASSGPRRMASDTPPSAGKELALRLLSAGAQNAIRQTAADKCARQSVNNSCHLTLALQQHVCLA